MSKKKREDNGLDAHYRQGPSTYELCRVYPYPTGVDYRTSEDSSYRGTVGGQGRGRGYPPTSSTEAYKKYTGKSDKPYRNYVIKDGEVKLSFATVFPDVLNNKGVAFRIENEEVAYVSPKLNQEEQRTVKEFLSSAFPEMLQPVFKQNGGRNR